MRATSAILFLVSAYLWSIPFVRLLEIPGIPSAFQLPEIIFLLLFVFTLLNPKLRRSWRQYRFDSLDYGVLGLVLSQWIAALFSPEALGHTAPYILLYLASLYFLFKLVLMSVDFNSTWLKRSVTVLGLLLVGSVLFSWAYTYWFPEGKILLTEEKYLPGLGWKQRIMGGTMSPNMLLNLLLIPLLLSMVWLVEKRTLAGFLMTSLLLISAVATWSKSLLLVGVGALVIILANFTLPLMLRVIGITLASLTVLLLLLSTKFLVLSGDQPDRELILQQSYATNNLVAELGDLSVYESMHYRLNREAINAFCVAPVLGIGPGQFMAYLRDRQSAGSYPANKRVYAPHSLYLGTLAQSGLLGAAALAFFLWALGGKWWSLWQNVAKEHRWLALGLGVYLLVWLVDGFSMDTLHFRHFWWVVIIVATWEKVLRAWKWEVRARK